MTNELKKILIVDDDEAILDALKMAISIVGYHVDVLTRGEKIFQKIREFPADLIILDFLLPGKNGKEIASELKSNKKTKHIPIVMISAHVSADPASDFYADDFLAKPFSINDLLTSIKKFLN
ncbi:response regulator [Candidatus Microgenomates bacterium]|nr:response regulator [Candidatus Microgenomates bacterium]